MQADFVALACMSFGVIVAELLYPRTTLRTSKAPAQMPIPTTSFAPINAPSSQIKATEVTTVGTVDSEEDDPTVTYAVEDTPARRYTNRRRIQPIDSGDEYDVMNDFSLDIMNQVMNENEQGIQPIDDGEEYDVMNDFSLDVMNQVMNENAQGGT